jgi:tRNA pseudouridine55 synthase
MDGLLVIDKPTGPTSHDVVSRARRLLRERRIGHAGTLDPAASGVLLLLIGRATRLARFLAAADKSYDATVRLGVDTDSYDATGRPTGAAYKGPLPSRDVIEETLDRFRGSFLQQAPAFSAKKVDGHRSYRLARARARAEGSGAAGQQPPADGPGDSGRLPKPAGVSVGRLQLVGVDGDLVTLHIDCSAGFYVRSLAYDLGRTLGTGAHLASLRRVRSGEATLDAAMTLDAAERDPAEAARRVVPLPAVLSGLSPIVLTSGGVRRAINGRDLGPADTENDDGGFFRALAGDKAAPPLFVRLFDPAGQLVGIAEPARTPGLLHPSVVLM